MTPARVATQARPVPLATPAWQAPPGTPAWAVTRESALRATRAQAGRLVIPELEVRATPGVRGRLVIPVKLVTQEPAHRVILGLALREIQELARKAIQELVILGLLVTRARQVIRELVTRARQVIRELVTRVQRVPQAIKATLELGILARQAIPGLLATQELATLEKVVTQG